MSPGRLALLISGALLLGLTVIPTSLTSGDSARRFRLVGSVVRLDHSPARIVVSHDPVVGLMPAMTMAFEIKDAEFLPWPGDRIAATLAVSDERSWLENVSVTHAATTPIDSAAIVTPAATGVSVPNLPLVDQQGRSIRMHDFAGRVVVLTFLYTRCPLPDFCPLMVSHLERVRRRANESGISDRVVFVGVTLDPVFDTPGVLHQYGAAALKGPDPFAQWTLATGSPQQIAGIARFFGIGYQPREGFVTHTLMTSVIGSDGRIVRLFPSNDWRPDDLFDAARHAIEIAAVY